MAIRNSVKRIFQRSLLLCPVFLILQYTMAFAGDYELSLKQRRAYDRIYVEVWAKSLSSDAPRMGSASLVVQYNIDYLRPNVTESSGATDSVNFNLNLEDPIDKINSEFDYKNGYSAIAFQSYGVGYFSLEVNIIELGRQGIQPLTGGRGSYIGKLAFDIINNPDDSALTDIKWSSSVKPDPGDIRIFDVDSNDVEDSVTFTDPGDFTVTGITIISPNTYGQVIDRDQDYGALSGSYSRGGYPIYYERSVNPSVYTAPVDENLAYKFEYSLDDGASWNTIGRAAESDRSASAIGSDPKYRSGEIFKPSGSNYYLITSQDGKKLDNSTYRNPVRVIWEKNPNFIERSEQARIRITNLDGNTDSDITQRDDGPLSDINDEKCVIGRLFFLQLNGQGQYLVTKDKISNSTQLTVEAWINLNSYQASGSEPGIVVSSGGPDAAPTNGTKEGAWMLYLKDGKIPAFRAKEIEGRGDNGYLASLEGDMLDMLIPASDSEPLQGLHSKNWVHLAATVKNNEASLYVNGELVDHYINRNASDIRMITTQHPIWIGVNPNDEIAASDFLHAGIKGVRVWRIALTQDQIRNRVGGVENPDDVSNYGDLRRGLDLYYSFEGRTDDLADDAVYQIGMNELNYYSGGPVSISKVRFRPDMPHIKLTTPTTGVGVKNKPDDIFTLRWVAYGMGDIYKTNSKDVEIEYTIDDGENWFLIKDNNNRGLGDNYAPDVEAGTAVWEPYLNNGTEGSLRDLSPYAKKARVRIRGTAKNTQSNLMDVSGEFYIAPYFAISRKEGSIISIDGKQGMNMTGDEMFLEAWIRPYRFPTEDEVFFPIITKMDSTTKSIHYALNLMYDGSLQFLTEDENGNLKIAYSDKKRPLVRPNSITLDTAWTHVGVYLSLNGGKAPSDIRFYIDGNVQRADSLTTQLGDSLKIPSSNDYPTFIGYKPGISTARKFNGGKNNSNRVQQDGTDITDARGFPGEIREVRFWNGIPDGMSAGGTEPTKLSTFVQGALAGRSENLLSAYTGNLSRAFSFNGGSFIIDGRARAVGTSVVADGILATYTGDTVRFAPTKPYIKLVTPYYKQAIKNSDSAVILRWVGFDYDGMAFTPGASNSVPPSFEFSILGGGGNMVQPYQYVGSLYWQGNKKNCLSFPDDESFVFKGTGTDIRFACLMDASIADPDEDNQAPTNDQGPLSATLTNARLRLTGRYIVNGLQDTIKSEGPLFTVTPSSNFTLRILLEGYHDGAIGGRLLTDLSPTYSQGGLKVRIFEDNSGGLGALVDSAESSWGYDDRNPGNRNAGNKKFANVSFIFTDLKDGNYWEVVDQINHLPVMSRYAVPFLYTGDNALTWQIESRWDFQTWNGADNNVLPDAGTDPWPGRYFTAYGDAYSTYTDPKYSSTGLIFNDGRSGLTKAPIASMVGGDVEKDGQINAADRVQVRKDEGTSLIRSDVTGDGFINATDRTIVDRNYGKVSSVPLLPGSSPGLAGNFKDPFNVISQADTAMSRMFNEAAAHVPHISKNIDMNIPQGDYDYKVSAEPELNDGQVFLNFFIENRGKDFAPANCTFAVSYDEEKLSFNSLKGADSVLFSNKPSVGYSLINSAPAEGAENPLPGVRTIEIDYDAFSKLEGIAVPHAKTYLGTLVFNMKRKDGIIVFNWHDSKAVHTVEGEIITEDGDFEIIPPLFPCSESIVFPNGGEQLGIGKNYDVTWDGDCDMPVYLELTTDAGISWSKLNTGQISSADKSYNWHIPDVTSDKCLIRIMDQESGYAIDSSNDYFTIIKSSAKIIKPSSLDSIYTGGAESYIIWSSSGYKDVRFEFSPDAGAKTWTPVTSVLDAGLYQTGWTVPKITTKMAMIRMIDDETGETIAKSSLFKILSGTLDLIDPHKADSFYVANTARIRWASNNVDLFDIYFSSDSGKTWTSLFTDVRGLDGYKYWKISEEPTDNALLRAIWQGDMEMIYDQAGPFRILPTPGAVREDLPSGYYFGEIYPNPAETYCRLIFTLPYDQRLSVDVYDSKGSMVSKIGEKMYFSGENTLEIKTNSLSTGLYYVNISSGSIDIFRKLTIHK